MKGMSHFIQKNKDETTLLSGMTVTSINRFTKIRMAWRMAALLPFDSFERFHEFALTIMNYRR